MAAPHHRPGASRRTTRAGAVIYTLNELALALTTAPSLYWRGRHNTASFVKNLPFWVVAEAVKKGLFRWTERIEKKG